MQVSAKKSYAGRLYHEDCSKEAQSARYRIKTVKRQKKTTPHRISHDQVIREYGSDCHICKEPIDLDLPRTHRFGLTVDHVIPVNKGGTDDMLNLKPAHWICNIKKSDKMPESDNA
jgi:5-methylcytosine-specific restriction endonuclease McrA